MTKATSTDDKPLSAEELGTEEEDSQEESAQYVDSPSLPTEEAAARVMEVFAKDGALKKIISARKSDFVHHLIHLEGKKFDFTGRNYLRPIYDRNDRQILLKTSRQVEKCQTLGSLVTMADGSERPIEALLPGDQIVCFLDDSGKAGVDTVKASEDNGTKPCLRIKTRFGSCLEVTKNHPLRTLLGWSEAGDLLVGQKIASLRRFGVFGSRSEKLAGLVGLVIGDGAMTDNCRRFTCKNPEVQDWFKELYGDCASIIDKRSGTTNYFIGKFSPVSNYFSANRLHNKRAQEKQLPGEAFTFDRESARDLIRGLWATDGHCKNVTTSKVDLVYCTTSKTLARQLRLLLRKFGVVTVVRENRPSNGGSLAYILRVVTRRSIEAFFNEIGPIPGKPFSIPLCKSNSNLDTLPKEIHQVILNARKQGGSYWKRSGLLSKGITQHRCYCPTFEKVSEINSHLNDPFLERILKADILWDEIVSIEDIGERPTWGIETGTGTYLSENLVNHNTTFLANNLTITSVVNPFNKSLYVSPSHTQTRQFSNEKLRPAIEKSPLIQKYFQDSFVSTQVFEKGFTNGSYVFLRSAFRSADRARGISARVLCVKGDTTVFLEDGQIVTIADLVREGPIGKRVLTLNEKTWALEYDEIIRATISPGKPSLRITSASGNFVELTEDHPVMTWDGWKKAGDVTVNDSILEARRIPSPKGSFFVNGGGDSDCCWQKVAAVESVPEEVVYDLTLRKNHNFFANTILVHNCLDEIQDMLTTEIPVIVECTSHFPDANVFMAGTPKSFDNPIEIYWQSTTQNEWLVPCTCGKWNFLDETNVAPTDLYLSGKLPPGPVCKKCMAPLHVPSGQWVSFAKGNQIQGYRIPQLMVPWICGLYEQWIKLLWKRDNYPFGQFSNEVLGLSYDSASKPITRDEILECCQDYSLWTNDRMNEAREEAQRYILTAGVDWGEGNDGSERSPSGKVRNASYTVLTIGGYIDQKTYKVFYAKRYEGREVDPDFVVKDIARICGNLGVKLVGVDWGHGWGVNNTLIRLLGAQRVVQFQYLPKLKQVMKWDQIGYRYHIQRNFIMSELFFDLKNKLIQFPRWKETEAFAKDILAIYSEYSEFRREIRYDHRPSDPDDFFHSLNYSKLASDIFLGKSRRYTLDVAREGMMK